jgi:chromosomal replication initiator protein
MIDGVVRMMPPRAISISNSSKKTTSRKPVEIKPTKRAFFSDSDINPQYTFKNFVVGPSNREAYQAALMISQNPGKLFNPVLIYGGSGLGKTHLLHAIGNAVKEKFPTMKVLYVHAQDFLNEFVKYVNGTKTRGPTSWSGSGKRSILLLVDDVQFLANKPRTEETFFSIYNNFHSVGKQVVLTSDQNPSLLKWPWTSALKSRFVSGLPLAIKLNRKRNVRIDSALKNRSQRSRCQRFRSRSHQLLSPQPSVKTSVFSRGRSTGSSSILSTSTKPSTLILTTAMDSVSSLAEAQDAKTQLSEEKIINVVADYYSLAPYQLTGKIRTSQIAMARHIAMYLIRTMLDVPFTKIGQTFGGKDHATVMNGVEKVENSLKTDKALSKAVEELKTRLKA